MAKVEIYNEVFEISRVDLVKGFIEANTKDDQLRLVMSGGFMLQDAFVNKNAIVCLSRDREYFIRRTETTITVGKKGCSSFTMPVDMAKKFVVALKKYAESDFMDYSKRVVYFNRMVLCIQ